MGGGGIQRPDGDQPPQGQELNSAGQWVDPKLPARFQNSGLEDQSKPGPIETGSNRNRDQSKPGPTERHREPGRGNPRSQPVPSRAPGWPSGRAGPIRPETPTGPGDGHSSWKGRPLSAVFGPETGTFFHPTPQSVWTSATLRPAREGFRNVSPEFFVSLATFSGLSLPCRFNNCAFCG